MASWRSPSLSFFHNSVLSVSLPSASSPQLELTGATCDFDSEKLGSLFPCPAVSFPSSVSFFLSYPIECYMLAFSFISLLHFPHSLFLLNSFWFCISRHPLCRSLPVFVYRWLHVCCVLLCCGRFNNHFVLLATDNEKYEAVKAALLSCEWYLCMSPVTVQLSSLGVRLGLLRLFILVLFTALSRFSSFSLLLSSRSTDSLTSPWSLALQLTWKPWDSSDAVL